MPPSRFRITLKRTMGLVAVVAIVLGVGIEVFVVIPRERPRFEHAAMHRRRADNLLRCADDFSYLLAPKLKRDMLDLAAWHRRRSEEIRRVDLFDPKVEEQIDQEHQAIDEAIMRDFYHRTESI